MYEDIRLYEDSEHAYILELWGGSTKHPDIVFYFDNFKKSKYMEDKNQVFQWILYCASELNFPNQAELLAQYALEKWVNWK